MKTLILILTSVCVAAGIGFYLVHRESAPGPVAAAPVEVAGTSDVHAQPSSSPARAEVNPQPVAEMHKAAESPTPASNVALAGASAAASPSPLYQQALSTLVSVQASYEQKQAAWKQMRDSGKLDQAMAELEQLAGANPGVAQYPAVLGQACLQKAGTLSDIREQGILGMKADQNFDAALNLDPSNWEAGFWKATAMSYWPPQLGKGQEVIERFVALVKQQEAQQPQPQFAQTYLVLGEQYQKQGYPDYAKQTWQRGATLFPNDPNFAQKLSQPSSGQAAAAAVR